MKTKSILASVLAMASLLVISCKKDTHDDHTPAVPTYGTVAKDATVPDQTWAGTGVNIRVAVFTYTTGDNPAPVQVTTVIEGTAPRNAMHTLRVVIPRSAGDSLTLINPAVTTGFFPDMIQFEANRTYKVYVFITSPTVVTGTLTVKLGIGKSGGTNTVVLGQATTFVVANVTTGLNTATPATDLVSGNQDVETNRFDVTATGIESQLHKVFVKVADPTIVESAKIYEGTTLLGQATFSGNSATVSVQSVLPKDVTKTFAVVLNLKPVGNNQSGTNIKTSVSIQTRNANGDVKNNDTLRTGNDIYVFKAVPTVVVDQLTGTMTNGVRRDVFSVSITVPSQGSVALKQIGLPLVFADNGSNDTLLLTQVQTAFAGLDVTSMMRISKSNGDTTSIFTEAESLMYITATASPGELIVPAGTTRKLVISLIRQGFDPSEGDGFSIKLGEDVTQSSYRFLNAGTAGFHAKLYSSATPANAGATPFHFIWSDMSSSNHSGSPGLGGGDWTQGFLLYQSQPAQVWLRR